MPFIRLSDPHIQVQVLTTTVFSVGPTSTGSPNTNSRSSVPLGAVIGGAIAGAVLAVVVTFSWICWGKKIKRDRQKQQVERDKHRKTRWNTMQNAQISGPKHHSYRPALRRQREDRRVKFAEDEKLPASLPPAERVDLARAKHMLYDNPNLAPPNPAWSPDSRSGTLMWPLRKLSQNTIRSNNDVAESTLAQPQHDSALPENGKAIPHKTSNVSTLSNASGESRSQGRAHASLIIAALGNIGSRSSLQAGDRQSNSSLWNNLFRAMPGARVSHSSSNSGNTYQPPDEEQAFPVGTAM